jgi:ATP-binding protein involved in chromosome partitioning
MALTDAGFSVGAVDADLNGPSLARMLGAHGQQLQVENDAVTPATGTLGVRLISTDLLLPEHAPLRWRNPAGGVDAGAPAFLFQSVYEGSVLRELIADVAWGALDFLLIDAPPGTDKLDRLIQLLPTPPTVLLVGTPSQAARAVVSRSATVARESGAREIGLVVNFAAHVCEKCGYESPLYEADSAEALAAEAGVPLWGTVPFDRGLAAATDRGEPFSRDHATAPAARAIRAIAHRLEQLAS